MVAAALVMPLASQILEQIMIRIERLGRDEYR
jgi:hypothetical protein